MFDLKKFQFNLSSNKNVNLRLVYFLVLSCDRGSRFHFLILTHSNSLNVKEQRKNKRKQNVWTCFRIQIFSDGYKCPNSSRGKVSSVAPTTKSEIEKLKTKALMLPQEMKARKLTFHHDLIKIPVSH